ncbi:MAG: hypothetical protein D6701_13435 [Gemmatimonadetes bacterium]|nr:MAG: hypothetical protein D6701_13435 [Gemmatimonadota bacterium]
MFVDLMGDLRRTVATTVFRAQVGPAPQRRVAQPTRLQYSGPSDAPGGGALQEAARRRGARPAPAADGAQVDDLGIAARAARPVGVTGAPAPHDTRQLITNRGEGGAASRTPVAAEKEPGRNDPCPCGSGKKYKKCHGRGA